MVANGSTLGSAAALWRYPVKSMQGEELASVDVTERGLLGDRAYALIDAQEGRVASAKNPRRWPGLFAFHAAFVRPPGHGDGTPAVRITLPDGRAVTSDEADIDERLSRMIGKPVRLESAVPPRPRLEEYWPDIEGLAHRETVTVEAMPEGTFFDAASLHLLTTATLDSLRRLNPDSRFEPRRFRPNLVVDTDGATGFAENDWIGKVLAIGERILVEVVGPCGRCVMTTLEQGSLPKDPGVLRTAAQANGAVVGVYARVLRGGAMKPGDRVRLA